MTDLKPGDRVLIEGTVKSIEGELPTGEAIVQIRIEESGHGIRKFRSSALRPISAGEVMVRLEREDIEALLPENVPTVSRRPRAAALHKLRIALEGNDDE